MDEWYIFIPALVGWGVLVILAFLMAVLFVFDPLVTLFSSKVDMRKQIDKNRAKFVQACQTLNEVHRILIRDGSDAVSAREHDAIKRILSFLNSDDFYK